MATVTITIAAGGEAGATYRRFAEAVQAAVAQMPDRVSSGASSVLTIDNAPATGTVSVQVTAGPYQGSLVTI